MLERYGDHDFKKDLFWFGSGQAHLKYRNQQKDLKLYKPAAMAGSVFCFNIDNVGSGSKVANG